MSAVPKKKLCWNCEGNVANNIDNCPYCGVYLHAEEIEDDSAWNPTYREKSTEEAVPTPLYQIKPQLEEHQSLENDQQIHAEHRDVSAWTSAFSQLKQDVFPILFLMMGSLFFLFGIVLLLFSQNGMFTLQWQERDGLYFLLFSIPAIIFGWIYLQRLDCND
ncbi:MAG: hypothetical protein ACH350_04910 [Parachlamydiaceae bacterium]